MSDTIDVTVPVNDNIQRVRKKTVAEVVDEIGLQAVETAYLDGAVAGTVTASKAVVADAAGAISTQSDHLKINSFLAGADNAGKTVRLNSITNIGTANSNIGFQSKPAQGAATAQNVIGCEISPRINDTFALTGSGTLIGAHVDAYLKGTTGDVGGDVRGAQIELVTDDAGARTITGDVIGLRMRSCFSATTITGDFVAFKVEVPESQTNSKGYDALFKLTGKAADCWNDDPTTELNNPAGTPKGYIKVIVNGADRYIALYEKGNLAD